MGQVLQAGAGQAPARQALLRAGLADTTPATTINRVCGSGLKSIMFAAAAIRAGDGDVYVAGGMESMNQAPFLLRKARFGYRLGNGTLEDSTVLDGLWCAHRGLPHGHPRRAGRDQRPRVARGPGRVRAREPPAGGRGHRRGPVRRRAGAGHGPRREGPRDGGRRRRGPAPRHDRRGAREAGAGVRPAGRRGPRLGDDRHRDRRQRARDHGRRRRDGRRLGAGRRGSTASSRSPGSSATRRPRSRRSGCSSRRSRACAASRRGRGCRSTPTT